MPTFVKELMQFQFGLQHKEKTLSIKCQIYVVVYILLLEKNINIIPVLEDGQLSTVFKLKAVQLVFQISLFEFSVVT